MLSLHFNYYRALRRAWDRSGRDRRSHLRLTASNPIWARKFSKTIVAALGVLVLAVLAFVNPSARNNGGRRGPRLTRSFAAGFLA